MRAIVWRNEKTLSSANIGIYESRVSLSGPRWRYIAEGSIEKITVIFDSDKPLLILTVLVSQKNNHFVQEVWKVRPIGD